MVGIGSFCIGVSGIRLVGVEVFGTWVLSIRMVVIGVFGTRLSTGIRVLVLSMQVDPRCSQYQFVFVLMCLLFIILFSDLFRR